MFDHILVPVDGSDNSLAALRLAVQMQEKFKSELLLLCVYRHYSLLEASVSMLSPTRPENLDDSMQDYATEVVEHAKNYATECGSPSVRGFIKSGQPARTIVKFAEDHDVNLIVLGSRGMGDVEGYLMGSVSHKVTSLAKCPVMVV